MSEDKIYNKGKSIILFSKTQAKES